MKIHRLKKVDSDYPDRLNQLSKPPESLSIAGGSPKALIDAPVLGIVGSRKATSYGRSVTESLATSAAQRKVIIVSGLALGVDSVAHRAALDSQGKTIAVLPGGVKEIYPYSHRSLAKRIMDQGGYLLSEYGDYFRPRRESFIQRNRLIAALSDVLLITEAAEKSGTLHTANFALELGKPVLAVPGNIDSTTSRGTNDLIKAGAGLVSDEADIYDALGIDRELEQERLLGDTDEETLLIELIRSGVNSGEEMHIRSGLPVEKFQQTLTMLEIKGVIRPQGNNHWSFS